MILPFSDPGHARGVRVAAADRRDRQCVRLQRKTLAFLEQVKEVLGDLRAHWPLTVRQAYYALVGRGVIPNDIREYQKVSRVLSTARIRGEVPWEAIEDRTRETLDGASWVDAGAFVADELDVFLSGYQRDRLQSQPFDLAVMIEKDALSRVCDGAARGYGVPVIVGRGNCSVSAASLIRDRVAIAAEGGRKTRLLYFGDLDPSGVSMLPSVLATLQVEMGLGDAVEGYFCALLPWHVERYGLPHDPEAVKDRDTRTPAYREKYGDLAVELDALRPDILQRLVRDAIEAHLDRDGFAREEEAEAAELARLEVARATVRAFAETTLAGLGVGGSRW